MTAPDNDRYMLEPTEGSVRFGVAPRQHPPASYRRDGPIHRSGSFLPPVGAYQSSSAYYPLPPVHSYAPHHHIPSSAASLSTHTASSHPAAYEDHRHANHQSQPQHNPYSYPPSQQHYEHRPPFPLPHTYPPSVYPDATSPPPSHVHTGQPASFPPPAHWHHNSVSEELPEKLEPRAPTETTDDENEAATAAAEGKGAVKKRRRRRKANEEPRDQDRRRFPCSHCGKMFARPSALQTHILSHTNEKPFVCGTSSCARSFSVAANLRRHAKIHNHLAPQAHVSGAPL